MHVCVELWNLPVMHGSNISVVIIPEQMASLTKRRLINVKAQSFVMLSPKIIAPQCPGSQYLPPQIASYCYN